MNKSTILVLATFFCFNFILKAQAFNGADTILKIEKAKYLKEDLNRLLQSKITYPNQALNNKIKGDVVISFDIDENGNLNNLNILNSPDKILATSSVVSLNQVENGWTPCKLNGKPIIKNYTIVFRYRYYLDSEPPTYKERAESLFKKQKYEKSLKFYAKAIKENKYDFELFESRARIKEILNDINGSKMDLQESMRLQNEIISIVDFTVIGISRVKTVVY